MKEKEKKEKLWIAKLEEIFRKRKELRKEKNSRKR